jgi:glycosyltransferase involved in cell wall biosynthesis
MNAKMKSLATKTVCMLSSAHPALDIRIYHKECQTLAEAGYKVTLIVPSSENIHSNGIRISCIPEEKNRFFRVTRNVWRIYGLARRERALVYHLHDPELIPVGLLLSVRGRRVVYDAHEDLPKDVLEKPWIPRSLRVPLSILIDWFEKMACRHFSAVVTADDLISNRLMSQGKRPITLNNYPLAKEFEVVNYSSGEWAGTNVIVSFGGLFKFRAAEPMIDAFGLLPAKVPVRLSLGGARESDFLQKELSLRPGWNRVDYRGRMSRSQMLLELSRAFAAIVLFSKAVNTHSVRSNRFYEALAAGVPVITPNFGDWKSIVEGNRCGLTVDPEDPQQIANAIEWLFSHPQEAAKMGKNGRELFRKQLNWELEGQKLLRLYAALMDGPETACE